ncbi:MAG: small subunit ribosomal protein S3 [Candidatus Woesearchaeota archaeon]|jgi:small subunit ribosomal protein S3
MIERKIVAEKLQEFLIQEFITETLSRVGHSHTELYKTPVGEKIIIHASRPGLIVGAKGSNIKRLTKVLKTKFKLENPQIEISEIKDQNSNAQLVAENIAFQLEKFGSQRFKGIGYSSMDGVMRSGALGVEILISGKLPSSRARTWRFYMGYLKKCGEVATTGVDVAYTQAVLKSGTVGIQVRIMHSSIVLPDKVDLITKVEELDVEDAPVVAPVEKAAEKKPTKSKSPKKPAAKKKVAEPAKKAVTEESNEVQTDKTATK